MQIIELVKGNEPLLVSVTAVNLMFHDYAQRVNICYFVIIKKINNIKILIEN